MEFDLFRLVSSKVKKHYLNSVLKILHTDVTDLFSMQKFDTVL